MATRARSPARAKPTAAAPSARSAKQAVKASKPIFNPEYPPLSLPFFSCDYFTTTIHRRFACCVGIREIGTKHGPLDVLLCACIGIPGVVYACTATAEPLWLRLVVAVEFAVIAAVSTIADGLMLHQSRDASNRIGLIALDRKTSVLHVAVLIGLGAYRCAAGHTSALQAGVALVLGLVALTMFHRRLYYTFVVQQWRPARTYARLWHAGATIAPLVALLALRG